MAVKGWFERLWLFLGSIARVITTAAGVIITSAAPAVLPIIPVIAGIPLLVAALAITVLPGTVIPPTVIIITAVVVAFRTMVLFSYNIQNLKDLFQYSAVYSGSRRR